MKKGFTLMELLVVIAIIAVVSVASTISFSNIDDATNEKELENKYIEIQRAASLYMDLHSDRLSDFVKDNRKSAYIPLSILDQEGYLTNDLSDPTGGDDISKSYSVKIIISENLESVETCIVKPQASGDVCIANKYGKKGNCCTVVSSSLASGDVNSDYDYEENDNPPVIEDSNTGITKFDKGRVVNKKMKSLAAGKSVSYGTHDKLITGFKYSTSLVSGFVASEDNTVSPTSEGYDGKPIYIWFDKGTIYYYSEANTIYLNADSYAMFERLNALKDISGLSHVNSSNAESLQNYFLSCYSIEDLSAIRNWNVAKVKSIRNFINILDEDITESKKAGSVKSLEPLTNWNVKSVIDMKYAFQDQPKIKNLKGLEKWNTVSLKFLTGTFAITAASNDIGVTSSLTDISALKNWNTSNVESLYYTFSRSKLTSLNGLQNWDTSKVQNMQSMFNGNRYLTNINALERWTTSNVNNMSYMFNNSYSLSDITPLQNWDVRKVKDFTSMFNIDNATINTYKKVGNIRSFAPISSWEPSSAENLYVMFEDQLKANDYNTLSAWKPYLTKVTRADYVFGLSSVAKNNGFACSNQLADLRTTLDWPTNVTTKDYFYNDVDRCTN